MGWLFNRKTRKPFNTERYNDTAEHFYEQERRNAERKMLEELQTYGRYTIPTAKGDYLIREFDDRSYGLSVSLPNRSPPVELGYFNNPKSALNRMRQDFESRVPYPSDYHGEMR
jgi:hypothetical protein